jgi:hypothetical protein
MSLVEIRKLIMRYGLACNLTASTHILETRDL